jgi:pimeloyl-ACP methyl ester carboxylesterase
MLSPHPKEIPAFATRAVVRKLQRNGWVIQRSLTSMEAGRDLLDFRLKDVSRPTLVVWGGLDKLIPLSVGESMHRAIPGSVMLVVDGCGHLAPSECWKPVVAGTLKFLQAN